VRPVPLAAISGVVRAADGLASRTSGGTVTAIPDGGAARLTVVRVRPDGTFVFEDMAPGTYTLRGSPVEGAGIGRLPAIPTAEVALDGIDVAGVVVAPERPVTVQGRLSLRQGGGVPLPANRLRVVAHSVDQAVVPGIARVSSPVADDLSFTLEVPRGRLVLSVASTSGALPPGLALEAVRLHGIEVSDVIEALEDVLDVEVVLTTDTQEVFGSVHQSTGAATGDYVVVLFAQDPSRWSIPVSRYVVRGLPNARGLFSATSLPPGDYYAVALPRTHAERWQDPRFLQRIVPLATPFSLDRGERIELKLTLGCERPAVC
jgi:hypothetical protein